MLPMIPLDFEDDHINQDDLNVRLTFTEHEFLLDALIHCQNSFDFSSVDLYDLPIESHTVQRASILQNLLERFQVSWTDRFEND